MVNLMRLLKPSRVRLLCLPLLFAASATTIAAEPGHRSAARSHVSNAATPLDRNLLKNAGFDVKPTGTTIPSWKSKGSAHTERFGSRSWPSVAYGHKWDGGSRYLACGNGAATVQQSVAITGWSSRSFNLKAHLEADYGGAIGTKIRLTIHITGAQKQVVTQQDSETTSITDSYRKDVVTLLVPTWATHIRATVQLLPKAGAKHCDVVADSVGLTIFKP
jgi:hypothetical protein